MEAYFDNAATTRVCPEAIRIMNTVMEEDYGNPSSTHRKGREARQILDRARRQVAEAAGAEAEEIFFTSGGSESDNWAIRMGAAKMRHQGKHILTFAAEHDAVRAPVELLEREGFTITRLAPDENGRVSPEAFREALREDTVLVSVMLVNNETGAVNPIAELARILKERKSPALLHTDAVQAFCKIPFSADKLGADMISLSSHKIHGPKGCGALYIRRGLRLPPLIWGGGQEKGFRSGTEAMPAIAGFGAAAEAGRRELPRSEPAMRALREHIAAAVAENLLEAVFIGPGDAPHILSLSLPGYRSEVLLNYLDAEGICVSRSSACKRGGRSHVLEAMRIPARVIDGAIRISLSRYSTVEEADFFVEKLKEAAGRLRRSVR